MNDRSRPYLRRATALALLLSAPVAADGATGGAHPADALTGAIDAVADFVLGYAITLAAVGALSMAMLEAWKTLSAWRDGFHKKKLREWLRGVPVPFDALERTACCCPPGDDDAFHNRVYAQLIRLTTGESAGLSALTQPVARRLFRVTPADALFALDLEKMLGEIEAAADIALAHPQACPELYHFLCAGGDPGEAADWYRWAQEPPVRTGDDAALAKRQADTYEQMRQVMKRRLDALHLTARYEWRVRNQFASVALGAVLLFVALVLINSPQDPWGWLRLVAASLLGGFAAPVAKDLVVAIQRMRGGG